MEMSIQHENSDINSVSGSGSRLFDLFCSETPSLNSESRKSEWIFSGPQQRLDNLMGQAGNRFCADCGSSDPKWVSSSHGVFICIKCSGIHRSLGVHISKVLSLKLDDWTDDQVDTLVKMGGNTMINRKYEACLPSNIKKPKPQSSTEERSEYIRRKYEMLQFLDSEENLSCPFVPSQGRSSSSAESSSSCCPSAQNKKQYDKQPIKNRVGSSSRKSWGRKESDCITTKKSTSLAGMIEFVGLVKVRVLKGINLAVRDIVTSDPYVILSLGNQTMKTRVIKNSLNPVWNESLMLSVPDDIPPLKVLVYDKDLFKADDFMGDAEIDIQPLFASAKAYEKSSINESMQLGKWVASGENNLVKDAIISLEDGKVKQDISIRLQNVERGVLDLELECVPLTQ